MEVFIREWKVLYDYLEAQQEALSSPQPYMNGYASLSKQVPRALDVHMPYPLRELEIQYADEKGRKNAWKGRLKFDKDGRNGSLRWFRVFLF